jgi:hypothetical protein
MNNAVGDAGASGLGVGLNVNSSLRILNLVSGLCSSVMLCI